MILRRQKIFFTVVLLLFFVFSVKGSCFGAEAEEFVSVELTWVVDGDTIALKGGERVRYAGIDTPERGERFYKAASRRNAELLKAGNIKIKVCREDSRDKYGRLLAWVFVDGVDVAELLLREGLARVMTIPPCGLVRLESYRSLELEAKELGHGIWSER